MLATKWSWSKGSLPSVGTSLHSDKTFPTLDCSACILTPKMVDVDQHPNITLYTWSEVENISGYIRKCGSTVRQKARYVIEELCTGCGICEEKCPRKVVDEVFEAGLAQRKAIYRPFPQAVPKYPVLDPATAPISNTVNAKPARSSAQRAQSTLSSKMSQSNFLPAMLSWLQGTTCSIRNAFPNMDMDVWPMSSPDWSLSAW